MKFPRIFTVSDSTGWISVSQYEKCNECISYGECDKCSVAKPIRGKTVLSGRNSRCHYSSGVKF